MALDLQQSLSDLQALLDGDKLTELGTELAKVKVRSRIHVNNSLFLIKDRTRLVWTVLCSTKCQPG